ncbi:MAG: cobalt-precorrin-6A reductase [Leptolyngbyaceae cyanobacterium RU_5_1]|nr:cobalt-precorrin-6A reductase [Leptolyngbyaceae cyanobacterium RU_5_1]
MLILGGTGDATVLAVRASEIPGVDVITALAGRTRQPTVLSENTRIGGFGGVAGLTNYLREQQIDLLIDATHPFAAQISFNAAAAAATTGILHLMLIRPAWNPTTGDRWIDVESNQAAATVLPGLAQRIFLTIGRQELAPFAHLQAPSLDTRNKSLLASQAIDLWFLIRMIDPPPPDVAIPPGKILLARGPFSLEEERSLLQQYEIGAIVSKNSGGDATYAKIRAARELMIPVVMIQRPSVPSGEQVETLETAVAWIRKQLAIRA